MFSQRKVVFESEGYSLGIFRHCMIIENQPGTAQVGGAISKAPK